MKAVRLNEWGQTPQIEDVPEPVPASDEVLVRVRAASLNPVDSAIAAGYMQGWLSAPLTVGTDFAGEVVSVGDDVTHVQPGDPVYGMIAFRSGTMSEYALPKGSEVALKPQSLDFVDSAAMVLVSLAAWNAVHTRAETKAGDRVLVLGAGGNVGAVSVRLAKEVGAYVIAANRPGKEDFVAALGADETIQIGDNGNLPAIEPVDAVINAANDALFETSARLLKPGGIYISALGAPAQEDADRLGIRVAGVHSMPSPELLSQLAGMVDEGKFRVITRSVFPMDEVEAAITDRMTSREPGKVVIQIV